MYGLESLLAGRTLAGRYRVVEVIGRGGMGAVYRAADLRLDREVALKVIASTSGDVAEHDRLRARFRREARAAAGLHHPNVVQVYDFGTDPDTGLDFLVMQLLRGEDLAASLRRAGRLSVGESLHILCGAAQGIAAGHRAAMVHRDVKPGNIFLEPAGEPGLPPLVRVLDFGIVDVAVGEEATMTHLTGWGGRSPYSPAFASPEQLRGEPRVGPASDVFSLGAVGYLLLTGERAFATPDAPRAAVELSASLARLRARRDLPAEVRALIERALQHRPVDRFPDAVAFADAVSRTLGTLPAQLARSVPQDLAGARVATDPTPEAPRSVAALSPLPVTASPGAGRGGMLAGVRSAWRTTVTCTVGAGFGWLWYALAQQPSGLLDWRSYLLAGALTVVAPLLAKRLIGRRSSYRLGLLVAAGVLWLAFRYADPAGGGLRTALLAAPAAQLLGCAGVARLLGRRPRTGGGVLGGGASDGLVHRTG